ncbi:MAG: phosphate acyltransferase PlsX [Candidatus Omnitrophota bacterium]
MKIVLDAMGGDYAPAAVIDGAVWAINDFDIGIILVGQRDIIEKELSRHKLDSSKRSLIEIHHANDIIAMDEPGAVSARKKKESSIVKGMNLIKEKKADAFVSAGNTAAVTCAGVLGLGLLSNIERPGIALMVPTLKNPCLILDVGANINPKPLHLLQYGIMGDAYMRYVSGRNNPAIGLLNIGEEEAKGTDFVKETHQLLQAANINFAGNCEGKDIFSGDFDVIICDGFVGNVVLKVMEGTADVLAKFLKRELSRDWTSKLGVFFIKQSLRRFKKHLDYSEYGGALLLGVDGIVIISHGRSKAKAIRNAIRVAKEEIERKVNEKIIEAISK